MLFISTFLRPSLKHSVEISKSKSINGLKYFLIKNSKSICLRSFSSSIINKKHYYLGANFKNSNNSRNRFIIYNSYLNKTVFYTHNNLSDSNNNSEQPRLINISRIDTELLANEFIKTLTKNEKLILKEALIRDENVLPEADGQVKIIPNPTWKQLLVVSLTSGIPFIGFGFIDNFLMIVAGDLIESSIGFYFPISTMAAAGLGNAVSDVVGIGLAHHIENFCHRIIGEPNTTLTPEQLHKPIVGWCMVIAKSLCIFFGCIIGMAPLLFKDHEPEHKENSTTSKSS